jgi:predicted Co/Zn/Cd cation transporter (cation efflux family)
MKLPWQKRARRPLTAEEVRQWHMTARLVSVALALAAIFALTPALRY